jgi:hypothetical protein
MMSVWQTIILAVTFGLAFGVAYRMGHYYGFKEACDRVNILLDKKIKEKRDSGELND